MAGGSASGASSFASGSDSKVCAAGRALAGFLSWHFLWSIGGAFFCGTRLQCRLFPSPRVRINRVGISIFLFVFIAIGVAISFPIRLLREAKHIRPFRRCRRRRRTLLLHALISSMNKSGQSLAADWASPSLPSSPSSSPPPSSSHRLSVEEPVQVSRFANDSITL